MRAFEGRVELEAQYTHFDTCGCGGSLTYKYKKKTSSEQIWIKPTMGMFQKFKDGVNVASGRLNKLKQYL